MHLDQLKFNYKFFNYYQISDFKSKYIYFDCFLFNILNNVNFYLTFHWFYYTRFFFLSSFKILKFYLRFFGGLNYYFISLFFFCGISHYMDFFSLNYLFINTSKNFKWY